MKYSKDPFGPFSSASRPYLGGFTLVEMLIVIALTAVLAAVALPSFNSLVERYRVVSKVDALGASFSLARVEAIRRGATVSVRSRGTSCGLTASATDWTCGWDVQAGSGATLETLKSEGPDARVEIGGGDAVISFDAFGRSNDWRCLDVRPQRKGGKSIQIILSQGGLARRQEDGVC
jgi:type IV fimbrial biogenesis protein FimT